MFLTISDQCLYRKTYIYIPKTQYNVSIKIAHKESKFATAIERTSEPRSKRAPGGKEGAVHAHVAESSRPRRLLVGNFSNDLVIRKPGFQHFIS